ncbi:MAG: CBS domain-containing protein [Candidatus Odinarchaeia archaeon]
MLAEELMTENYKFVQVPGTRKDVLEIFKKHGVTGLPVLKKGTRKVSGIITRNDLMRKPDENQIALIMTRDPITISPDTELKEIAKIMFEKRISYLPVVKDDEMVGLVTLADVVWKGIANLNLNDPIKPHVIREITAVWEKTPISVAYIISRLAKTQALTVLNDNGVLTGIITDSDILEKSEVITEEKTSNMQAASEGSEWDWDTASILYITKKVLKLPTEPVSETMIRDVITVVEQTSISECAAKMKKYDIDQMPVLNATGELVGMIRDVDLLKPIIAQKN